jgi:hypothetical protein
MPKSFETYDNVKSHIATLPKATFLRSARVQMRRGRMVRNLAREALLEGKHHLSLPLLESRLQLLNHQLL